MSNLDTSPQSPDTRRYEVSNGTLTNVHRADSCRGPHCCIHNPSDHPMRDWPQAWRSDRRLMERICTHGVGHPDPDDPQTATTLGRTHGCDGCCEGAYGELAD